MHTGKNRKVEVEYMIKAGLPHYISTIDYNIPDSAIAALVAQIPRRNRLTPGDLLDRNRLEEIRSGISDMLRDHGYYAFSKDYITFVADTAEDARDVNLTLNLRQPSAQSPDRRHLTYLVDKVVFVTDYNPGTDYGNYDFRGRIQCAIAISQCYMALTITLGHRCCMRLRTSCPDVCSVSMRSTLHMRRLGVSAYCAM